MTHSLSPSSYTMAEVGPKWCVPRYQVVRHILGSRTRKILYPPIKLQRQELVISANARKHAFAWGKNSGRPDICESVYCGPNSSQRYAFVTACKEWWDFGSSSRPYGSNIIIQWKRKAGLTEPGSVSSNLSDTSWKGVGQRHFSQDIHRMLPVCIFGSS